MSSNKYFMRPKPIDEPIENYKHSFPQYNFTLSDDEIQMLQDACLDDATRIIRYLEESDRKQKRYNILILVITTFGAIGSIIAAITGVFTFFQ